MCSVYFCDKETFNCIFNLEKSRSKRHWNNSYIFSIKIDNSKIDLKKARVKLHNILAENLRVGDLVCQWKKNHYLLIINNINKDNIYKVKSRISNKYFNKNLLHIHWYKISNRLTYIESN